MLIFIAVVFFFFHSCSLSLPAPNYLSSLSSLPLFLPCRLSSKILCSNSCFSFPPLFLKSFPHSFIFRLLLHFSQWISMSWSMQWMERVTENHDFRSLRVWEPVKSSLASDILNCFNLYFLFFLYAFKVSHPITTFVSKAWIFEFDKADPVDSISTNPLKYLTSFSHFAKTSDKIKGGETIVFDTTTV